MGDLAAIPTDLTFDRFFRYLELVEPDVARELTFPAVAPVLQAMAATALDPSARSRREALACLARGGLTPVQALLLADKLRGFLETLSPPEASRRFDAELARIRGEAGPDAS